MGKKNVTFGDIAEYTGFSKTTVSRYFNDPDSVTLENQQIIADALKALNYKENKVARILANGKTEFIGVVVPDLYLGFYSDILDKLLSSYEKYGYKFIVFAGNGQQDRERRYIEELLAYKIEGMIILSHALSSEELASYNVPVVVIEREDKYVCSVNTDNLAGGVMAAEMLLECGCERLFHINSKTAPEVPAYGRIAGFRRVCKEKDIRYEMFIDDWGSNYNEVIENTRKIIEKTEKKYGGCRKGFFISNDTHANIFLNLLIRKYGKLPDDFRIVGFDNSTISSEAVIPISTIAQQTDIIAAEAMALLSAQMNEQKKRKPVPLKKAVHKVILPVAVQRETTRNDCLV